MSIFKTPEDRESLRQTAGDQYRVGGQPYSDYDVTPENAFNNPFREAPRRIERFLLISDWVLAADNVYAMEATAYMMHFDDATGKYVQDTSTEYTVYTANRHYLSVTSGARAEERYTVEAYHRLEVDRWEVINGPSDDDWVYVLNNSGETIPASGVCQIDNIRRMAWGGKSIRGTVSVVIGPIRSGPFVLCGPVDIPAGEVGLVTFANRPVEFLHDFTPIENILGPAYDGEYELHSGLPGFRRWGVNSWGTPMVIRDDGHPILLGKITTCGNSAARTFVIKPESLTGVPYEDISITVLILPMSLDIVADVNVAVGDIVHFTRRLNVWTVVSYHWDAQVGTIRMVEADGSVVVPRSWERYTPMDDMFLRGCLADNDNTGNGGNESHSHGLPNYTTNAVAGSGVAVPTGPTSIEDHIPPYHRVFFIKRILEVFP